MQMQTDKPEGILAMEEKKCRMKSRNRLFYQE